MTKALNGSIASTATTATLVGFTFSDTLSIDLAREVDIVDITLQAGWTYAIEIGNGAAGDLNLRLFDASGA